MRNLDAPAINTIDYSETAAFLKCPVYWYLKYIQGVSRQWVGQREDALAMGSMFHAGVENFYRNGVVGIPEKVLAEYNPTTWALSAQNDMLTTYAQHYPPQEGMQLLGTEELCTATIDDYVPITAKVDAYFEVPEDTYVPGGISDEMIWLSKGVWIQEYKTRAAGGRLDTWLVGWERNLQADFQILCLRARLGREDINGLLINTVEKPASREATRKCPACKTSFLFSSYVRCGSGFVCPGCGGEIELKPPPESGPLVCYRFPVYRTDSALKQASHTIQNVYANMQDILGKYVDMYKDFTQCVHPIWGKCDMYDCCATWDCTEPVDLETFTSIGFTILDNPVKYREESAL